MKSFAKIVFATYLTTLLWLVLFKFSFDIFGVLLDHQTRSINLIPFAGYSPQNVREMIDNFVVFVPFGLLLGVVFKRIGNWQKLAGVFAFSLSVEVLQFVLAIGTTDITDVITNTLGGLAGLELYRIGNKFIDSKKLDWFIIAAGLALLALLISFRVFVLRVRY